MAKDKSINDEHCEFALGGSVQEAEEANSACVGWGKEPDRNGGKPPKGDGKKMIILIILIIAAVVLILGGVAACFLFRGKIFGEKIEPAPIVSVSVAPVDVTGTVGNVVVISASVTPEDANVVWSSSDNSIATVAPNGEVLLHKAGEVEILCTLNDTVKAVSHIIVVSDEAEIMPTVNVTPVEATDTVGNVLVISATVTPEDANVTWTSSDSSIATVATNGEVQFHKAGEVEILCTLNDTVKAVSHIKVVNKLNKGPYNLGYGTYSGPMTEGEPDGFGGEIKVTSHYYISLMTGEKLDVVPGDRIVNCKFRQGKLVQGFLKRANGEGRDFMTGIVK